MNIKCILIEETGNIYLSLRRFQYSNPENVCPVHGYHTAHVLLDIMETHNVGEYINCTKDDHYIGIYKNDFPKACDCGYVFTDKDEWQIFKEGQYKDDKGNFYTLTNAPVGAIWRGWWYEKSLSYKGPDGKCYVCKTPGGEWIIDGRASNCTMPDDTIHKCWCRHGEAPNFTIDKNGNTCAAGAGSIAIGSYHGYLQNGELTDC